MVRAPDGTVRHDPTGRANGRGAYVCRDVTCIDTATGRGNLAHALEAKIPTTLSEELRGVIAEEATHGT